MSFMSNNKRGHHVSFLVVGVVLAMTRSEVSAGKTDCTSAKYHPALSNAIDPVLIRCWQYINSNRRPQGVYLARYERHMYAPVSNRESMRYGSLDWFWTSSGHSTNRHFVKLLMKRHARVYLAVPIHRVARVDARKVRMGDWEPVEEAVMVRGQGEKFQFGVYQTYFPTQQIPERVFIFQKRNREVILPDIGWINKSLRGFEIPRGKNWFAMVAEGDGSKWKYPPNPPSVNEPIVPNQECPEALHRLWVTPNTDDDDEDTRGMMWPTWHPVWDPIYWCTYGHEHGSSSVDLMGYWPKYGYTAWKNGREDESNEGFKNIIVDAADGKHRVLYMVHMQTSKVRRVYERWHTIMVVVVERRTGRVRAEVSHKGDFGALTVRIPDARFMAVRKGDQKLMDEFRVQPRRRSINIMRGDSRMDPRLQYRHPLHTVSMGVYEDWSTSPICSGLGPKGSLRADITQSATGVKGFNKLDQLIHLGRTENGVFYRQAGQSRILLAKDYSFGGCHCEHRFNISAEDNRLNEGVFYTNAMGTEVVPGPARNAIRQFVDPRLKIGIKGEYRALNNFNCMLALEGDKEVEDVGFGLNPDIN